jgi:copper chaperone CopZ
MATFKVSDMTCGGCAASITKAVQRADPAARVAVDLPGQLVRVESAAIDDGAIAAAIEGAGFTAVARGA